MFDPTSATRRLALPSHLGAREREALERAATDLDEGQRRADARRRKALEALRHEHLRELTSALGEHALAELREATRRERQALRDLFQPPAGLGIDESAARMAATKRIERSVGPSEISAERLRRLNDDFDAKVRAIVSEQDGRTTDGYNLEANLDRWLARSPLHSFALSWGAVPPPDEPGDPHRWLLFKPPFFGFLFGFWYQGSDGFQVERDLVLEPQAAWVGNTVNLTSRDGDFGEVAQARADSQIAFGFVAPAAGIVEILVDAQSLTGTYDLRIRDNFGFSSASADQFNYLMVSILNPLGPEQLFIQMDKSHASSDGDDVTTQSNHLSRLQHYVADVVSTAPVAAGDFVVIAVGTRSVDIGSASRMDLLSTSDFSWFISSVEVRIVP